tara:strand:- start:366 stop:815 length:450 start_codon:yes stop_codon:yes gene_type:complete
MVGVALYKPDIPQNTGAIVRFCACFGIKLHIIEPCGFNINDKRFKRVTLDYREICEIIRYDDYKSFTEKNKKSRIILMTTKANKYYHNFSFKNSDIILFGRESSGAPQEVHNNVNERLKIPISKKSRSLNIVTAVAVSSSEAIRQTKLK